MQGRPAHVLCAEVARSKLPWRTYGTGQRRDRGDPRHRLARHLDRGGRLFLVTDQPQPWDGLLRMRSALPVLTSEQDTSSAFTRQPSTGLGRQRIGSPLDERPIVSANFPSPAALVLIAGPDVHRQARKYAAYHNHKGAVTWNGSDRDRLARMAMQMTIRTRVGSTTYPQGILSSTNHGSISSLQHPDEC